MRHIDEEYEHGIQMLKEQNRKDKEALRMQVEQQKAQWIAQHESDVQKQVMKLEQGAYQQTAELRQRTEQMRRMGEEAASQLTMEYHRREWTNAAIQEMQALHGTGTWQISPDGDTEAPDKVWMPCLQLDTYYQTWMHAQCPEETVQVQDLFGNGQCRINFSDFFAEFDSVQPDMMVGKSVRQAGPACQESGLVRLPLRRVANQGHTRTHPPPDQPHPWYLKQVLQREQASIQAQVTSDGAQDWLTNDFFWQLYQQACKMGGGRPTECSQYELFDFRYNADFRMDREPRVSRRGGVLYREPKGWKTFAINTRQKYNDQNWLGDWAVAYHGCPLKVVPKILETGFRPGPLQGTKNCNDCRTGEEVGTGIFCSPNIAVCECYSNGEEGKNKGAACTVRCTDGKKRKLFVAIQCLVNPARIRRPIRTFAKCNDEEVMGVNGVFEWVINNPDDIRPVAVMVRDMEDSEHRNLKDLVETWNEEHKPLSTSDPQIPPLVSDNATLLAQIGLSRQNAQDRFAASTHQEDAAK